MAGIMKVSVETWKLMSWLLKILEDFDGNVAFSVNGGLEEFTKSLSSFLTLQNNKIDIIPLST